MTKPIHTHDCESCKFLGTFNGEDLYYHPPYDRIHAPQCWTLISRFGVNGDYCSAGWKTNLPQLLEARVRAAAAGHIKFDEYS